MKFAEVTAMLKESKNDAYVLEGRRKGRQVLVSPSLTGRVVGTTYSGDQGQCNGFLFEKSFREGMTDIWNNWGGEERYWLAPEGGPYSIQFDGRANYFDNYHVQDGLNSIRYETEEVSKLGNSLCMKSQFGLKNNINTEFELEVTRRITALDDCPYLAGAGPDCDFVGFQSESTVTNLNSFAWTKETGSLAHWHLGQFHLGPKTVAIAPFRQADTTDPPIREDYFREFCVDGRMPANRYWIRDGFVLFLADGTCRTKIGQNRSRATGLIGSFDLENNELHLMQYDFYPELEYIASYWYEEQTDPYGGDCISMAIEGPDKPGGPGGNCYELESLSPAMLLEPGQSFTFRTRTMHLKGPRTTMAKICRRQLGPEISTMEAFIRQC